MALPSNLTLEVVTAERSLVNETIDEAEVPGSDGYFGVLPGHTPFLAALKVGDLWFRQGEKITHLSVAFGFAEVLPDRIRILAKNAELAQEIDVNRAKEAEQRARAHLGAESVETDFDRASLALERALIRLRVAATIGS
tara:strand:+ start:47902 stop:48318 length:417 start_codon:yes stop_codon:yes gene_type:complete